MNDALANLDRFDAIAAEWDHSPLLSCTFIL